MAKKKAQKISKEVKTLGHMLHQARAPRRITDPVTQKLQESQANGREAALAVLNPIAAVNRGFQPGRPDGEVNATVKFVTTFKQNVVSVAGGSGPGSSPFVLSGAVAPFPYIQYTTGLTFDTNPKPLTNTLLNDPNYAEMLLNFEGVRAVAQCVSFRCVNPPLDLDGERTLALGGYGLYGSGYPKVTERKDVYTIGNNKPGEVSMYVNPDPGDGAFHAVDWDWITNGFEGNCMHFSLESPSQLSYFVEVLTMWEGIPLQNSLLTPTEFVADPAVYAAALSAALDECPLNSHERISYEDDGLITSALSDVKTILGAAQKGASMVKKYKKTAHDAVNFFDSFGAGIGRFVSGAASSIGLGGLFSRQHSAALPESKEVAAADTMKAISLLYVGINSTAEPGAILDGVREVLNGRTNQAVWEYCLKELKQPDDKPPRRPQLKPVPDEPVLVTGGPRTRVWR